jgi:pyrophosphatase PpaX
MTAFIFDLDGTLANSIPYIRQTVKESLDQFGLTASEDEITSVIGLPLLTTGEQFLGELRAKEYMQAYSAIYKKNHFQAKAFDGLNDLIEKLHNGGAKLAIATSKRKNPTYENLEQMGLLSFFPVIINSETGCGFKPSPGPALQAMSELGSLPEKSYFIGDSVHDIACATGAGIKSIAVTWGSTSKECLQKVHPTYICDSVNELSTLLQNMLNEK